MSDDFASDQTPVEDRIPPSDMQAEAAVLHGVMTDPNALPTVAELLAPEHMYAESHRRILEAAMGLYASGKPTDAVHVGGWLRDHGRIEQVGGAAYLATVLTSAPVYTSVRPYAMRVQALWRLRQVQDVARRTLAAAYHAGQEASAFCETAAQEFHQLAYVPGSGGELEPVGVSLQEAFARVQRANDSGQSLLGIPTGIDALDRVTGGLHDGELTIVAARPGKGKSSAVLQWALHAAALGKPTAFFSLEMPKQQIAMRSACVIARVDVSHMRLGTVTMPEWARLTPAAGTVAGLPLYVDDTAGLTAMGLRARLRRMTADLARAKRPRPALVVVDYLQLMHATTVANKQGRERAVAEVAQDLKEISKEFAVPVVAPCQMNRAIEQASRRPRLSDLRESGNIEQAADTVIFIHEPQAKHGGIVEFIVEKQRNGPNDAVCARFVREFTCFDNLAEGEWTHWSDDEAAQ